MTGYTLQSKSKKSRARVGVLQTMHGNVATPFFLPIATKASVKGVEAHEVVTLGAEMLLANTYHLFLQPGLKIIQKFGGMHDFMKSSVPILTDSGGFQVFSLKGLRKLDADGVTFQSHLDGTNHRLTPQKVIDIQATLGSDVMMVLDYFPGFPAKEKEALRAVKLTSAWAAISRAYKKQQEKKNKLLKKQMMFAIVQGSTFRKLREQSARELIAMNFDGYAVGGLAVGEPAQEMYKVLKYTVPLLPEDKPRYLMGVGYPENIVEAVKRGIDMFDCVIPTREGRHGRLFIWKNQSLKRDFYDRLQIERSEFKADKRPVDKTCDCPLCTNYSRAYLNHLFKTKDYLGQRLATLHNLRFYMLLMERIKESIISGLL